MIENKVNLDFIIGASGGLGLLVAMFPELAKGTIGIILVITITAASVIHLLLSVKEKNPIKGIIEVLLTTNVPFWGIYGVVKYFTMLTNK